LPSNSAARRSLRGLAALGAIALAVPASAAATNPGGTCTNSYQPETREQFVALGADAAQQEIYAQAFDAVNKNGDAYICFKYYPNGPHDIHQGTLVDNNAAPHAT
jgi:hypothetical protein